MGWPSWSNQWRYDCSSRSAVTLLAALTGTLRRSRVFETWQTTTVHVRSAGGPLRLARDGETFDGAEEFEVTKNGARLAVFTPGAGSQTVTTGP